MSDPNDVTHGAVGQAIVPSSKEQVAMASHAAIGLKKIRRGKSHEPSRARDEFGDVDTRLAKIELKLIDGDDKLEELEAHVEELDRSDEEFGMRCKGLSMIN